MKKGERGEPKVEISETYAAELQQELGATQAEGRRDVTMIASPVSQEIGSLVERNNQVDRWNRRQKFDAQLQVNPEAFKQQAEAYHEEKVRLQWLGDALARLEVNMPLDKPALDYLETTYIQETTEAAAQLEEAHNALMEVKKNKNEQETYDALEKEIASLAAMRQKFEAVGDATSHNQALSLATAIKHIREAQKSSMIGQKTLFVERKQSELRRKNGVLDTIRSYPVSD